MENIVSHWEAVLIASAFLGLVVVESSLGIYRHGLRSLNHWWIDLISLVQLALFIKPLIFFLVALGLWHLMPGWMGAWQDLPFWLGFMIVFLPDDFSHYWYHRLAHEKEWMWPWHRTHHSTPTYHTSIAFRENWAWFWFMPGIWWSGAMVYMGLVEQVALSTAIIGLHNVLIHNGLDMDKKLYQSGALQNVVRLFESIIQTPSLHRGHHGLGRNGVPYGNYGQTLFIWDVLFGTATFVQDKRPERYGVTSGGEEPWYQQLWLPYGYKKAVGYNNTPVKGTTD